MRAPYGVLRERVGSGATYLGLGIILGRRRQRKGAYKLGEHRATVLSYTMRGMQWRCTKHGHLLDPMKHLTSCPIDGSPVTWQKKLI